MTDPIFHSLDLLGNGLLPQNWEQEIRNCSRKSAFKTELKGDGSTSREKDPTKTFTVYVVDGKSIASQLPWLWDLYEGPLLSFAARSFGRKLYKANSVRSAININVLKGQGASYEWHVDSNPVTGLLFASDSNKGDGGSLVFKVKGGSFRYVRPKVGTFICFDARDIPHRVAPLRSNSHRISVPMNFYESEHDQQRPGDLDDKIYTAKR